MGAKRKVLRDGPYSPEQIADILDRKREELGIPVKAMLGPLRLAHPSAWTKRVSNDGASFTVADISACYAIFERADPDSVWPGFPFIPEALGRVIAARLKPSVP